MRIICRKKPKIKLLQIPSEQVDAELKKANLKLLYPVLLDSDQPYYFIQAKYWADVFNYIYFENPMPKYIEARIDCDDFAIWMKGLVSSYFGLNYFGIVFGNTIFGGHAWNLLRADTGLLQFEPQTGQFFELREQGYFPEWVII